MDNKSLIELLRNYTQADHGDMVSDPKHLMNLAADALEKQNSNRRTGRQDFYSTDVNR